MLLQSSTLSNQDISSGLLVGTYTATLEVSDLSVLVAVNQIAGDGNYSVYATRQLLGAGAEYKTPVITEAVAVSETNHVFSPIELSVNATDVVKVYLTGLVTDTTTPDTVCEFWGLAEASVAGGSSSPLYASLAQFKAWIAVRGLTGTVGTDSSDDTVISSLLEAASRYVDNQTGRRFYQDSTDTDYYYNGDDEMARVMLPDFAAITTVSVDYTDTRTYTALTATDFDTLPDNAAAEGLPFTGLEAAPTSLTSCYFPTWRKSVKVTGKRGWPAVPADIRDAVLAICESLNSNRSGQASSGKMTITAAGIVIRPEDVPPFAQKVIQQYRKMI